MFLRKSLTIVALLIGSHDVFAQQVATADDYLSEDSIPITLPDGGTICMQVIRRKDASQQPSILWYDIYADSSSSFIERSKILAAKYGYALLTANPRGKKCSPDSIKPFETEAEDAYHIIDWISKQPWSNGKVGMLGGSYLGFSQWATAKKIHPALKTIVPQVSVGIGIDYPTQNGVFTSYTLRWVKMVTNNKLTDFESFNDTLAWPSLVKKWYAGGYPFRSLDSLDGQNNHVFQNWLKHPTYDDYWKKMTPQKEEFSKINIPILSVTGYWDDDQLGAMYYYKEYMKYNPNGEHYLLIGPYDHPGGGGYIRDTVAGMVTESKAKEYNKKMIYGWFDYILKDSSKPELLKDKVNFFMTGENKWYHAPALDQISNNVWKLYLNNGRLEETISAQREMNGLEVDLKKRDLQDYAISKIMDPLPILRDTLEIIPDQKYFYTDIISEEQYLCGDIAVNLIFKTNKKDVDFLFDLYEVKKDGKTWLLNEFVQRASLIKDRSRRNLLKPGKTYHMKIDKNFIVCKKIENLKSHN